MSEGEGRDRPKSPSAKWAVVSSRVVFSPSRHVVKGIPIGLMRVEC
ncbi:MAG: hypothetical protein ACRC8Y_05550 [Chroococcales cyanobacterium]